MHIRLLIALIILISGSTKTFGQTPDAIVEVVVGKALVKDTKESKEHGPLKDGDGLFAGQWVSCATGCERLIISSCNVSRTIGAKPKWKQIYAINCKPPDGQRGGGKGSVGAMRSPIDAEVVRPATFSLKWRPSAFEPKLELWLRIVNGERIWGPFAVDGSNGNFTSDSLKAALKRAQANGTLNLELSVSRGSEETQRIKFNLISTENEVELERKLELFNVESNEITKAMGRASVFGEFDLIASEVTESERALAIAKISEVDKQTLSGVEELTLKANLKARNTDRVRQLCGSFTALPTTSQPVCVASKGRDKPRITVLATASNAMDWTTQLTTVTLEDALIESERFELIDRTPRDMLLNEQGFSRSHAFNTQEATKLGKLLSARYIIVGNALDVTVRKKGGASTLIDFGSEIKTRIQMQVIDVETGAIPYSKSFEQTADKASANGTQADKDEIRDAYLTAMEAVASKFVAELNEWVSAETLVLQIRGVRVALDVGSDQVKTGQEFEVYTNDAPILGPDGKPRGYVTTKHARLRIEEVNPLLSWATVIATYDENGAPDAAIRLERIKKNMNARRVK